MRGGDLPAGGARPGRAGPARGPVTQPELLLQVDGALDSQRRGRAGAGIVVRAPSGRILFWHCQEVPAQTCNEAEYQALIVGMRMLLARFPTAPVRCVSDSRVVLDQMAGRSTVRAGALQALHVTATDLARRLPHVRYVAIPRELNRLADALAWESLHGNGITRRS